MAGPNVICTTCAVGAGTGNAQCPHCPTSVSSTREKLLTIWVPGRNSTAPTYVPFMERYPEPPPIVPSSFHPGLINCAWGNRELTATAHTLKHIGGCVCMPCDTLRLCTACSKVYFYCAQPCCCFIAACEVGHLVHDMPRVFSSVSQTRSLISLQGTTVKTHTGCSDM